MVDISGLMRNTKTSDAIFEMLERAEAGEDARMHLGASVVGHECQRRSWLVFRWAQKRKIPGRILALMDRGKREEEVQAARLRAIGVELLTEDPKTGMQFGFQRLGGHFSGSADGIGIGFPEAPKTKHLWECKLVKASTWRSFLKKGVRATSPLYYSQAQIYMRELKVARCFFMAINKDTDEIFVERIRRENDYADEIIDRASRIVQSDRAPIRVSEQPGWHVCKMCEFRSTCQLGETSDLEVNCRTCAHITVVDDGSFLCEKHRRPSLTADEQRSACSHHLFNPDMLPKEWTVDIVDSDGARYRDREGRRFLNREGGGIVEDPS